MTFELTVYQAGYCTAQEKMTRSNGRWKTIDVPALFFTLDHPTHGRTLIDTGYAPRFHEVTQTFPASVYARTTPTFIEPHETAAAQVDPTTVDRIILTHLHADHVAGLKDFPDKEIICFEEAYTAVRDLSAIAAIRAAYIADLIPEDFAERSRTKSIMACRPIPYQFMPFTYGWDIFADQSLIGVHLPGHAYGQMGLFVHTADGYVFLCADACWHSQTYRELAMPHFIANLIQNDAKVYRKTIERLHDYHLRNPDTPIFPSHCPEVVKNYSS